MKVQIHASSSAGHLGEVRPNPHRQPHEAPWVASPDPYQQPHMAPGGGVPRSALGAVRDAWDGAAAWRGSWCSGAGRWRARVGEVVR